MGGSCILVMVERVDIMEATTHAGVGSMATGSCDSSHAEKSRAAARERR